MNNYTTIGTIAREAGIPASAIRYYESIGLLPEPERVNGRRRYDGQTGQRLQIIRFCQQASFTLMEIRDLFFGFARGTHPSARWEALAKQKMHDVDAQIAQLQAMQQLLQEGLQCGCLTMEQCVLWLSGPNHDI
jgi:MerR family transcriptional regulator, redox-sensitive transcriptional activator SoxR